MLCRSMAPPPTAVNWGATKLKPGWSVTFWYPTMLEETTSAAHAGGESAATVARAGGAGERSSGPPTTEDATNMDRGDIFFIFGSMVYLFTGMILDFSPDM